MVLVGILKTYNVFEHNQITVDWDDFCRLTLYIINDHQPFNLGVGNRVL